MKIHFRFLFLVLILVFSVQLWGKEYLWGGKNADFFDDASAAIEKQIAKGKQPALDKLYKELYYAPIWVKSDGLSPFGRSLLDLIENDETVTPPVKFFDEAGNVRRSIEELVSRKGGEFSDKVKLELAMSKLFLHYARYRIYGGISWGPFERKLEKLTKIYKIKVGWEKYAPPYTPAKVLGEALNTGDLAGAFENADPKRFQYDKLKNYLVKYIRIAENGGWPKLPGFGTLKPGRKNAKVVPLIRRHLQLTGDLEGCTEPMDSPVYDKCMAKAVKKFQLRHGLKGSGIIGRSTRAALNTTVTQAIQKIRLNLDRIKWLNRKEEPERIELNIPSFRLNFFAGDKLVTTIRVITGKPNHPTPSFHNRMKYIVVNPWWKIPESIVRHEMLSKLIQDPYHYEAQGKELHESWDENSPRIDPGTVDWAKYLDKSKKIPYCFMQVPSRHNALGKIKFLFPNGYQVYIHDTPSKSLFFRNIRAFSHGCMRIQKPRELLESLALFNSNIDVDAVMKQLEGTDKKTILLNHSVPIDITYLTAFVDPYGYLNFRKDIYRYDKYQMKDYATKCVSLAGFKAPKRKISGNKKQISPQTIPEDSGKNKANDTKSPRTDAGKNIEKKAEQKSQKTDTANPVPEKPAKEKPSPRKTASVENTAQKPVSAQNSAKTPEKKSKDLSPDKQMVLPEKRAVSSENNDVIARRKHSKKDPDGYQIIELYDN